MAKPAKPRKRVPDVILEVGASAGSQTYVCFVTRSVFVGRRIQILLNELGAEGHFEPHKTFIVFGHDNKETNVMIVLPADTAWEELVQLMVAECQRRLSLRIERITAPEEDRLKMVIWAQQARSQDN